MKTRHLVLLVVTGFCFAAAGNAQADGITAVMKSPSMIYRLDATTGAFKGSIQVSNAVSVGCDGTTIAVLLASNFVNRYSAETGAFQGAFQVSDNPQSVQVSGGVIAVRTANYIKRYKATTGAFLGSNQI
jgi:hypothetical protein